MTDPVTAQPPPASLPAARRLSWLLLLQGTLCGLGLVRVTAETSANPWPGVYLLLLGGGGIVVGLILVWLLHRLTGSGLGRTWPLFLPAGYLLWPQTAPAVAGALGLAAALIWMRLNLPAAGRRPWPEGLVLLAGLALYGATLAPSVLPADSGEFQLVSAVLGIAHPPGYPLYTMLGRLFTLFTPSHAAYGVNLLSAVCAALTLTLLVWTVRHLTGSTAAALVAAGALGLSTTFWAQATTANIRSLTTLLTMACLALLLRWGRAPSPGRLAAFAFVFGLAVGHHASLGLLGIPFALYVLAVSPRMALQPRQWLPALGAFIASLLVLLYLPLRSRMGAPFDPSPLRTLDDFLEHVLALGFRGDMLYYRSVPEVLARGRVWLEIVRLQFGPLLPWAATAALIPIGRHDRRALLLLVGVWAVNTAAAITYRAPQTVEYLLPSYVAMTVALGLGLGLILRVRGEGRPWPLDVAAHLLVAALAVAVVWNGAAGWPSFRALHRDTSTRDWAVSLLRDAQPNAQILSSWHHATPLWYLQMVEGMRPDVEVVYVYPEGDTPNEEVWLRRIDRAVDERPVLVTNHFHAYEGTDYRRLPLHGAWQMSREAPDALPSTATPHEVEFGGGVRLLGYELEEADLLPGQEVVVRVYWQVERPLDRDHSAFVQLLGPAGVVGQGDRPHRATDYAVGEIVVDSYRFPLLLHAQPADYRLIAGFYYTTADGWQRMPADDGGDHVTLSEVRVHHATQPAATLHPLRYTYAGGLQWVGVDYDRGVPGQTRVYLHWRRAGCPPLSRGPWAMADLQGALIRLRDGDHVVGEEAYLPALAPGDAATVAMDLPDGIGEVKVDLLDGEGRSIPFLGPWHRPASSPRLILPVGAERYVPLGGEMIYCGSVGVSDVVSPGQPALLNARFLALRPLTADYTVSAGLLARESGWERRTDGTPALGMIPTLKWVRGWQVTDYRTVEVPAEAEPGEALPTLVVYDAFTLQPLQVLDERLVQRGQGTHLELAPVTIR
jgi:hypothetical protein